jgi:hypothetical protein
VRGSLGLQELLDEAESMVPLVSAIHLDNAQRETANNVLNVVESGGVAVGIGPPGTGKTAVINIAEFEVFEGIDRDEAVIYVAPTNRLVRESAVRTLALLLSKGYSRSELSGLIRVYGSQFKPEHLNEDVRIVFTTPYQPGALKSLSRIKRTVHLMVDEASTTPLHGPFIEIAMAMADVIRRKQLEWIYSFSVIGDPMQAIAEEYTPQEKFKLLIVGRLLLESMPKDERERVLQNPPELFELAEKYSSDFNFKYSFLEYTYRIPRPTESIVSKSFYKEKLKGVESYDQRLKDIKLEAPGLTLNVLQRCLILNESNIRNKLDNALDSQMPVVYIEDKGPAYLVKEGRRPKELEELDVKRARAASEIAAYLATSTLDHVRIDVLTPYVEMKTQIQSHLNSLIGSMSGLKSLKRRIRVSTVHSALGSEADIVVAVLGKEYRGREQAETIYFQTPDLVNVQFSRHKRLLVIIGNIKRLARAFKDHPYASHVSLVADALNELKGMGLVDTVELK